MWVEVIMWILMGICAVCDVVRKEIPLAVVWLGMIVAVLFRIQGITEGQAGWLMLVFSLLPGVIFWILSFITKEKVGYGDGWMLAMIGLFVGVWECLVILLAGLIMESVMALILLAAKKITGDRKIPFAPFLLLGMGATMCF